MTESIKVTKLTNLDYSSDDDEQKSFNRIVDFHAPIAALLAMQEPGTLLMGEATVFWLACQPGKTSFDLVYSPLIDGGNRVEGGRTFDMIEGLGCDDLNTFANQLQAMIDKPLYKFGVTLDLPIWMEEETEQIDDLACFEVDAHENYSDKVHLHMNLR